MYLVKVIVEHNGKEVFYISQEFTETESRDYVRSFLRETGNCIESYDYHFDDDYARDDEDLFS